MKLYSDRDGLIGTSTALGGTWSVASDLSEGEHQITATATDAAGNESAHSAELMVVVDTTQPDASEFRINDPVATERRPYLCKCGTTPETYREAPNR